MKKTEVLKHIKILAKSGRYIEMTKAMKLMSEGFREDLIYSIAVLAEKVNRFIKEKEDKKENLADETEKVILMEMEAIISELAESSSPNNKVNEVYSQVDLVINRHPKACSIGGKKKIISELIDLLKIDNESLKVRKIVEGLIITVEIPDRKKEELLNISTNESTEVIDFIKRHNVLTCFLRKANSVGPDDVALEKIETGVVANMDIMRFIGKSMTLYTSNAISTIFFMIGSLNSNK